jgi:autotransporter-associated beta strand protein
MWTTLICLWLALSGKAPHVGTPRRRPALRRPPSRPQLEPLEDRLAPATLTWSGGASQLWSNPDNWVEHITPYTVPPGEFVDLVFPRGGAATKVSIHDLPDLAVINSITFEDPGYTIKGGEIKFLVGSIVNAIPSGSNLIANAKLLVGEPISLRDLYIDCQGNSTLNVVSDIVGGGRLVKVGPGELYLPGHNSYRDGTELREGTITVDSDTALGVGRLWLFGGRLEGGGPTLANPIDVRFHPGTTAPTIGGGGSSIFFTGTVQILTDATLTIDDPVGHSVISFSNTIFGPGRLTKTGAGILSLSGNNLYEGGTDLQEGVLFAQTDNALGKGLLKLSGGELSNRTWDFIEHGIPPHTTLPNRFEVSAGSSLEVLGGSFTFTGEGTLLAGGTLTVKTSGSVSFLGALGGEGALTEVGGGQMILSGDAANTYTGTTTVNEGTLVLSKPEGVNAITGDLVIGTNEGDPGTAVVSLGAAHQIDNLAVVTINLDGLWEMHCFDDKVGSLAGENPEERVTTEDPPTLTVGFNNRSTTFGGVISGPGTVVKVGTGTWTLTGANTYTGGTVVNGGTLLVNGSLTGPVTVNAGATLGGTGATGPVTLDAGATVSPGGAAPGLQRVQDLALAPGSSFVVQLDGLVPGTGYDQLDVTGTVRLNGATLDAALGFDPAPGDAFVLIKNDGTDPVDGTFAGLPQGASLRLSGVAFHIYYDGGDGNDVALIRNVPPAVTRPGDQTAFQNVDLAVPGLRVTDPDDANLMVTLQVSHGTLTLGTVAGLTVGGNGTSSVSLSGSQAALNAALAGLLYQGGHNYSGPDMLTVTASDGLDVTSAGVAIRVKSLAEQAADLQSQVNTLRAAGVLNQGRANSLLVKLDLKNNNGDIGRVQAFLHEVDAFLQAGILSVAQADALLGPGNILLLGLRRR